MTSNDSTFSVPIVPPDTLHQTEALVQARMDIAVHKAEIASLREDIADMRDALTGVQEALRQVQATLSEARGGWRTLLLVGGASGSIGVGITWLANHLPKLGP